jgi:PTS system beta-glucosides-specific IIC component
MAKITKNYAAMKDGIVGSVGGVSNISNVSHCMTRLRLQIKDRAKFNEDAAKSVSGVLNVVVQNGEYQFVIGQDVPSLYEEFEKIEGIHAGGEVEDAAAASEDASLVQGNVVNRLLSFIGGVFSPVIPVLIAGGLTGAVLTILTTFFGVTTDSGVYNVFSALNQATFYFLPVFIGFSCASRMKSNGYLGAFLGAVLLFVTINFTGAATPVALDFLGIPIAPVTYNSTVFPVILGTIFMAYLYRGLQKVMPVYLRTVFVPLVTMLVSVPVTLVVLGPIGNWLGTLLATAFMSIYKAVPPLAVALVGVTTCWMVFFGMNNATYPVVFALLASVNSDPLICTGMAPANVAVGGACLAAAILSKKLEEKSVAVGAGITALCGITEPGVYGVLFVKRYPLVGAMVGGGVGGFIAGLFGLTQYVVANPGFISFAAYIAPDGTWTNFIGMMLVMILALVLGFVVTYVFGKHEIAKGIDVA